jgi:uncharacterized protein YbbK (DUF523 family)
MILVSSCLLGVHAKYDGTVNNKNELLMKYVHLGKYLPVCPEQIGGLPTPRPPVEIIGGIGSDVSNGKAKIKTLQQEDITALFLKGAEETLRLALLFSVKAAVLKERSPSCGVHQIYNGRFSQTVRTGSGVTAALLRQHGIEVYSEEEISEERLRELLDHNVISE